ncbi:MAG: hypothetical protein ACW99A_08375 [Candidatus Kariarchaeaceae archaeon]
MASIVEQILALGIVLGIFFEIINKVVRLASRTWDERENLDDKRVLQVMVLVPILLLLALIAVYYGVLFLIQIVIF